MSYLFSICKEWKRIQFQEYSRKKTITITKSKFNSVHWYQYICRRRRRRCDFCIFVLGYSNFKIIPSSIFPDE